MPCSPTRRSRIAWFVAAVAIAMITPTSAAFAHPVASQPAVYALDGHGHVLLSGAILRTGQHLLIVGRGFGPRSSVEVVDTGRRTLRWVRADGRGVSSVPFTVPSAGKAPAYVDLAGPAATQERARRAGTAEVEVPLLRQFGYRIRAKGRDVDSVSVGLRWVPALVGPHSAWPGLATTGSNIFVLFMMAIALAGTGIVTTVAERRRRTASSRAAEAAGH